MSGFLSVNEDGVDRRTESLYDLEDMLREIGGIETSPQPSRQARDFKGTVPSGFFPVPFAAIHKPFPMEVANERNGLEGRIAPVVAEGKTSRKELKVNPATIGLPYHSISTAVKL